MKNCLTNYWSHTFRASMRIIKSKIRFRSWERIFSLGWIRSLKYSLRVFRGWIKKQKGISLFCWHLQRILCLLPKSSINKKTSYQQRKRSSNWKDISSMRWAWQRIQHKKRRLWSWLQPKKSTSKQNTMKILNTIT